mgnify:FL=1
MQVSMIYGLMDQFIDDNLRGEGDRSLLKLTIWDACWNFMGHLVCTLYLSE